MIAFLILFLLINFTTSYKYDQFINNNLSKEQVKEAQQRGKEAYESYLEATQNASLDERNNQYEMYFLECNNIGKERTRLITKAVEMESDSSTYKVLLTLGLQPFVARFMTLPKNDIEDGLNTLCDKFEEQLQCQQGFGESRARIMSRVEQLKLENGNLQVLLDEHCSKRKVNADPFFCIGNEPLSWSKPCLKEMLAYNYTRYSAGRRIAKIHLKSTASVNEISKRLDLEDPDEIMPLKDLVQSIMKSALLKIAEIESEKCDALNSVLKCILPTVLSHCGAPAEQMLKTIILQGYLPRERREVLQSHFVGFGVDPHPKCIALHPNI